MSAINSSLDVIWILNKDGLCFIQRVFNKASTYMDEMKFSGLITSILMFAKDVFEESFEKLTMGEKVIYLKSFSKITIALATKRGIKDKDDAKINHLIEEIGQAFQVEYTEFLETNNIIDSNVFSNFGKIIDQICGIQTFIYLDEHDSLLSILKDAELNQLDESTTIKKIASFLDDLSDYKLDIIINTAGEVIQPILSNTKLLSSSQKKRYQKLIN
jgi:hypothetical protein